MSGLGGPLSSMPGRWPRSLPDYGRMTLAYLVFYSAVKTAFIFSGYDLFTEEAQYWLWSRYPDWSYYSKPPLIAWVNFATGLLGQHDSILRFTALAFGLGTLYVVYRVALLLFHEESVACLSVLLLSVSPYFVLASTFFTTDSLLFFFWTLAGYFLIRGVLENRMRDWIAAGFAFGMGCLSKYSMFLFLFSLLPLFMLPDRRKYVTGVAVFFATGLMMFAPVIVWNYLHDWVTFRHVFALAHGTRSAVSLKASALHLSEFLGGVLLVNSPFLLLIGLRSRFIPGTATGVARVRWLLVPAIATFVIFFLLSIFKRTEVNWPAMSYLSLPIVLAWVAHHAGVGVTALRLSAVTLAVVMFFLFPPVVDRIGLAPLLPLKIDSMKRMAGWEELSSEVKGVMMKYPEAELVVTDSYHVASELSFYGGFTKVLCINAGRRMNQFDIWRAGRFAADRFPLAIYVTELDAPPVLYDGLEDSFTVPVFYRGTVIRTFRIFVLKNFRPGDATEFDTF